MKIFQHNPETVPTPVGNYSQAIEVSGKARLLFVSGQIPETVSGEVPADIESQCETIWSNISEILKASGMNFANLVKVTTYLTDAKHSQIAGDIRRRKLGNVRPALTAVVVQTLDSAWLLEIEAIAVAEDK